LPYGHKRTGDCPATNGKTRVVVGWRQIGRGLGPRTIVMYAGSSSVPTIARVRDARVGYPTVMMQFL